MAAQLKFDQGGRPFYNDDLVVLSSINAFLDKIIAGRANLPYVVSGCKLGVPTGSVYPISEGIVFLNGKLLSVDATTQNLSTPKYLGEGEPADSSNRIYETGDSYACISETKAEYSTFSLDGQNLTVTAIGVGSPSEQFWASFATDTELATLSTQISNALTNYYTKIEVDEIVGSLDENIRTYVDDKFTISWITLTPTSQYSIDAFGFVRLRGLIETGSGASAVYATLPIGYRPLSARYASSGTLGDINFITASILTNGDIVLQSATSNVSIDMELFLPFAVN